MKKILALILALAMCFALVACGGKADDKQPDESKKPGTSQTDKTDKTDDKVYELVVVNHDAVTSMGELYVETLFNAIAAESNGRLKFTYQAGGSLFGAAETIDAVKVGSADICWATTGTYGGVFPLSEFINLVGNGIDSASKGSAVYNTMVKEIPEVAAELEDWKVLAVHGTSNAPISTVGKKIETVNDFKGVRVRVAGTIPTLYAQQLGLDAVALPTSEVYDNLSKHALDGMLNDWHNIDCFRLFEPIDYCMNVSLNQCASFVLMNQDMWDSLPADLQAIFDKYFASGFAADMAGYWWDSCRYWVGDKMKANGVEVYEPSAEVYEFMFSDAVLEATHKGYVDFLNSKGYDGQAMYDKFMAIVARYDEAYAHVWDKEFNYADWDMSKVDGYKPVW